MADDGGGATAEAATAAQAAPAAPPRPFFVGIGSSAGGLEALTLLLPGLPAGLDLRFVVVQHMSPTHRSLLAQLLGRSTTMPVLEISDGCVPEPDRIYVTPPNKNVALQDDHSLRLFEPPPETVPKPSVNAFFTSLAEVMADHAVGIVLSGTGSDGTLGLQEIKAAGGYAFAQEPSGAKYDGMVRAAIDGGGVDWVLPAESMGAEIGRIVQRHRAALDGTAPDGGGAAPATLQTLLRSLYAHTGIDFTGYKEPTLLRRIERRMAATRCLTLEQYFEVTRNDPKELHALAQDMLISVTSFFRDRAAFDRLREELVRKLQHKPVGEDLRVWVAGCASGEEAYSMAILLNGVLDGQGVPRRVQIFATDIDDGALMRARRGVFAPHALHDLDGKILERHFKQHAEGWEVNKSLRDTVLFARHNVVQDPPFVRLDLISCRNVLIYLQSEVQNRLLASFHYALQPAGLLFLGRSESVHGNEVLFEPLDRAAHLFRRGSAVTRLPSGQAERETRTTRSRSPQVSFEAVTLRAAAHRFAPPSVLVDGNGDVRHFSGDVSGVMSLPEGRPGFQLMTLLRRELRPELARLLRSAKELAAAVPASAPAPRGDTTSAPVVGRWRSNRTLGRDTELRMSVQWVSDGLDAPMLLVCFERRPLRSPGQAGAAAADDAAAGQSALEEQLASTREHLYTVIEELETTNEESQALNEEVQTANEELQATNEELEASNEELQASNEELTTVNEELQVKSVEWQAVNAELESIYSTVDFPLLAFDSLLALTRANRAAQRQLGIDAGWLGRAVHLLPWPNGMPSLREDLLDVLGRSQTLTRQLTDVGGRHWALRIMPRSAAADGRCSGTLVQMVDNTRLYDIEAAAGRSHAQLQQLVERSALLVCICDPGGRLQMVNPEFERCHRIAPGSAAGKLASDVLPAERVQPFRDGLAEAIRRLAPFEIEERVELQGQAHDLLAAYFPLLDSDGAVSAVCYQAMDITQHRHAEAELLIARSARLAAEGVARTKSNFLANMSHEIRTPMNAVIGLSRLALEGELPPVAREHVTRAHQAAQALMGILDDVLDYSKIEAGELRFESNTFRLSDLLLRVRDLFSANAEHKGVTLVLEMPLGVPTLVQGDPLRLSQVLNNLVGNALKFTEHGEVRIAVSALDPPAPGRCLLRFTVRDTGIGIAPDVTASLFDAFTQGDGSITRRFGGTGLGLAICRHLVGMMDGRIGVNSEPGRGSEFWFTAAFNLPARGAAPGAPAVAAVAAPVPRANARDRAAALHGLRVLLAEDNALNQVVGVAVLEQFGLEVSVVANGQEALDQIAARPAGHFAAVLMDMHMPVMDGLEATRRLRQTAKGTNLPVVAVTAAALSEDRAACLAAGMNDHIAKPLVPDQLVDSLLAVIGNPTTAAEAAAVEPGSPVQRIPGFDLQRLAARLQGRDSLMWQVLAEFADREASTGDALATLLAAGRLDEARRRTHELVGSAGTIGAALVASTAAGLEAALGAGVASAAMLQSLREALSTSLATLREALAERVH